MQELGTDVNLYALVFGESVLNDAVRVILFLLFSLFLCFSYYYWMLTVFLSFFFLLCAKLQMAISLYRYFFAWL